MLTIVDMRDQEKSVKELERVRAYFDRDTEDYDSYFEPGVRTRSLGRALAKKFVSPNAPELRMKAAIELCGANVEGKQILEVGCGPGRYSIALARRGAQMTGIDFSPKMIEIANRLAVKEGQTERCRFEVGDILTFRPDQQFQIAFATGVLDYIPEAQRVPLLARMKEVASEAIIVSFPKLWHYHAWQRMLWLGAKRVPVWFYTETSIAQLFRAAGLEQVDSRDTGIVTVRKAVRGR